MTATHFPPEVILQLQEDAKTMNCKQMADKHGITCQNMRGHLKRLGIKCQRVRHSWSKSIDELKTAAAHMTPRQMGEHFGMNLNSIYTLLQRHNIKAVAPTWTVQLSGRLEALQQLAPGMTVAELAAHFEVDRRTVGVHLKRLGLECKSVERAPRAPAKPKPKRVAAKKPAPRAKVRPKQIAKPAPKPAPAPVPKRAAAPKLTIKREVQIITPANVKRTIVPFCPSKDARFCNGSSAVRYDPKARTVSVRGGY